MAVRSGLERLKTITFVKNQGGIFSVENPVGAISWKNIGKFVGQFELTISKCGFCTTSVEEEAIRDDLSQ